MGFLDSYLEQFKTRKRFEQEMSLRKSALELGSKYLSKFDYCSDQVGLLFGNIQSGKTSQMFGIASEAADRGFLFFLLLETDSTLLQQQTYERAQKDLKEFVICDENEEQKFRNHGAKPVMVVVKKNSSVLKTWADRFKNSGALTGNPLFIIDDEADAVSLNTKVNQKQQSKINGYLDQIKKESLASIYLQVTATPQALLLQTQQSGWHPMFTYYFNPGKGYLGGNFFFPESQVLPKFLHVTDNETPLDTAKHAVLRHLIVSAQLFLSGEKVSNCIIHPGIRKSAHEEAKKDIEKAFNWWAYHHDDSNFKNEFDKEYESINPEYTDKKDRQHILNKVQNMMEHGDYSILMLNGTSTDGSDDYATGCNFIIGGTNLGRGVTFGQLNTFVYTRTSKNPQADTMWQHSRIFGYDRDPGLVSMYSSTDLYRLFSEINATNNSIVEQSKLGKKIEISYPDGLRPTRSNVLDKSALNILAGGSNHFPLHPTNTDVSSIEKMLSGFSDNAKAQKVSIGLLIQLLKHVKTEKSFDMDGYIGMLESEQAKNPGSQGRLLVRRNRDILNASRALLSPNDWAETNQYEDEFVVTMYRVIGQVEKGWNGESVWVPNIKLPKSKNFYVI